MHLSESIIRSLVASPPQSRLELQNIKRRFSNAAKVPPPSNSDLLAAYRKLFATKQIAENKFLERMFRRRDVRTLSGVTILTVLTKPYPCPGKCTYCPTEAIMPKSYLSREPAAARALANKFDPYMQIWTRLTSLHVNGHPTDKVELIIKGGTWNSYPWQYQKWFVKRCFEACNNFRIKNYESGIKGRTNRETKKINLSLEEAQRLNEKSKHRIIGLTIETRPDWINAREVARFRELGVTRVELGVQTTREDILLHIKRGHGVKEVIEANGLLRDAGFKVDMHMMPQLPGATAESDVNDIREIFDNPGIRPDMLKIYPTAVVPYSALYAEWKMGKYKPYPMEELFEALIKMKLLVPRYCRITRLIRDIPSNYIFAGNKITNLREDLQRIMRERGLKCRCLRCREVGHQLANGKWQMANGITPKLFVEKYECAGGMEYFLSYEDAKREVVFAFCRLRVPLMLSSRVPIVSGRGDLTATTGRLFTRGESAIGTTSSPIHPRNDLFRLLPEIRGAAFIRELHTYGQLVSIGKNEKKASQHKGLGSKLMYAAEKIAQKIGAENMAVIAGVGVRGFYRKLGYRLRGTYMMKPLRNDRNHDTIKKEREKKHATSRD